MNKIQLSSAFADSLPHPKYRADIDGLRAVAVLAVIGFHAFPESIQGGFAGVDIFFVISGFLISTIIFSGLGTRNFSFAEFYIRRVKRIFPSLLVVLFCSLFFGWFALLADEYRQLGKHVAGGAGFISNFMFWNESGYFDSAADTKPLLHLWSLGIEEQFYLFWPLVLWLSWKARFNLVFMTVLGTIISFALGISKIQHDAVAAFYSPLMRFWELLAGAGLAYTSSRKGSNSLILGVMSPSEFCSSQASTFFKKDANNVFTFQSIAGAALIACSSFYFTKEMPFPGWLAVLPISGAILVIASGPHAWFNREVLSSPLLVWIGLISFPLYLWHWPLLTFARILEGDTPALAIRGAVVLLSFLLAWLTYKFIEKPIRFGKVHSLSTIALVVLMGVSGWIGYEVYSWDGIKSRAIVLENFDPRQTVAANVNPSVPCTGDSKYALVRNFCRKYVAEYPQKTIVLWGDSTSAAWRTVFLDLAKEKNYNIIVISHEQCDPLLDAKARKTYMGRAAKSGYCEHGLIQEQALELIKEAKPDMVVLMASWVWLIPQRLDEHYSQSTTDKDDKHYSVEERVRDTARALENFTQLVIFRSWPLLPKPPNYKISRISFLQREPKKTDIDAKGFKAYDQYVFSILKRATSHNTIFFSPADKICTDKCALLFHGVRMYQDAYHITAPGSMQYRVEIEKLLEKTLGGEH